MATNSDPHCHPAAGMEPEGSLDARMLSAECAEPTRQPEGLSTKSAIATLTQNVLGTGVLSLPFAMSSAGIVGGTTMLLFVYALCVFTMGVLVALSNALGTFSYKGAAEQTLGRRWAVWIEIWVLCCNLGFCTSFVIILGDFSFALAEQMGFAHLTSRRGCMGTLVGLICWPLSCAPSLGFLRWMSLLGLASILFCVVAAGIRHFDGSYLVNGPPPLTWLNSASFGDCFPILVGAFGAHTNIPLLYREVAPQAGSPNFGDTQAGKKAFRQMMTVIVCSLSISCVVYGWVGIVVYATFGSATKSDFSENFRPDDNLLAVLRLTMTIAICSSYGLMLMSARAAAFHLFMQPYGLEMTRLWRIAMATVLTAFCLGIAVVAKEIGTVLAYNGSVFATPICFIIPTLMYICLPRQSRSKSWSVFSALSALAGAFFALLGIAITLRSSS
mmetsp:Transcript_42333/g.78867  ORF Transcript_42333/g.78867 Transcript_42333/m.78867 type:complete len:443 (-) Transcript_42333:60-1388(-)